MRTRGTFRWHQPPLPEEWMTVLPRSKNHYYGNPEAGPNRVLDLKSDPAGLPVCDDVFREMPHIVRDLPARGIPVGLGEEKGLVQRRLPTCSHPHAHFSDPSI